MQAMPSSYEQECFREERLAVLREWAPTSATRATWCEGTTPGAELETTVLPDALLDCLGELSRVAGRAVTFCCAPSAYLPVGISAVAFQRIVVALVTDVTAAGTRREALAMTLMGMRAPGGRAADAQLVLLIRGRRRRSGTGWSAGKSVVRQLAEASGGVLHWEPESSVSVSWPALDPRRSGEQATDLGRATTAVLHGELHLAADVPVRGEA